MTTYTFHLEFFILLTSAAIVSTSPSNMKIEFMLEDPSQEDELIHTSAFSLSENNADPDDLSDIPEPLSTESGVPEVYSLNIWSSIKYRYATTLITSRVVNRDFKAANFSFNFFLPKNSFVSCFLMEVKGKVYKAIVKEKEVVKNEFEEAIKQGITMARAGFSSRGSNLFSLSVNLEPRRKMTFNLTYEELLTRRHGLYDHVIHLVTCNQIIQDMKVEVYINEPQNFTVVKVPEPTVNNGVNDAATGGFVNISMVSSNSVLITYAPTIEQQEKLKLQTKINDALHPDINEFEEHASQRLRVQYDLDHQSTTGKILLNDGYFVHLFAPSENIFDPSTKPIKHVIFVLSTSESMKFGKLKKLQESMELILDSLNDNDYFSIIEFSSTAKEWKIAHGEFDFEQEVYPATPLNIFLAKTYISNMQALGANNIADALKLALNTAERGTGNKNFYGLTDPGVITAASGGYVNKAQPIIIFIVDNKPTVGNTNPSSILHNTREQNKKIKAPIFSLAFGDFADLEFLRKLSFQNFGFSRKIYEAYDTTLQMKSFFEEVSSPLLNDVTFSYASPSVDRSSLTKSTFHTYFAGTEIIIAGRVNNMTSSPEDLGSIVSSSNSEVTISVYEPRTNKEPKLINLTNTDESREEPDNEVTEELEMYAGNVWPSETLGKETHEHTDGSLERIWAYLTICQLLDKDLAPIEEKEFKWSSKGKEVINLDKKKALQLALKYGFVTPLTSLEFVEPPEKDNEFTNSIGDSKIKLVRPNYYLKFRKGYKSGAKHGVNMSRFNKDAEVAATAPPIYLLAKWREIAVLLSVILLFKF